MDFKKQIDVSKISEIFLNMSYGENNYEPSKAVEWLNNKNILFAYIKKTDEEPNGIPNELENILTTEKLCTVNSSETETIKQILSNIKKNVKWIQTSAIMRSKILYSLGQEIERNSDLFAKMELVIRGIKPRDTTNNTVPLLAQYFYYYSIFAHVYGNENINWEPPGASVGVISNGNMLSNLGLYLAPALAAGYNIILQVGTKIAPCAYLLQELAKNVGIAQDVIRIIPSDDGDLVPYFSSPNVAIITAFANIYNNKYRGENHFNKKVLTLCPSVIPVLVFDNADLDSACESIIATLSNSSNSHAGSEAYIFVQENILSNFINKLKNRLRSVKVGRADEKQIDIAYPLNKLIAQFPDLLKLAEAQGYEVYRTNNDGSTWSPTLFIGNATPLKTNAENQDLLDSIASIVSFRSVDEAITLVNNLKYGLGLSLWSENIRVINEITKKVETSNIWINRSPNFTPDITFSPMKMSGFGYFGGKEGFYEYVEIAKTNSAPQISPSVSVGKGSNTIDKLIEAAKKTQLVWKSTDTLKKISIFQKVAERLEQNKSKMSDIKEKQQWLDIWIKTILECVNGSSKACSLASYVNNKVLISVPVPKGVIVTDMRNKSEPQNILFIVSAIFEGNTIIILDDSEFKSLYEALSILFPSNVLSISSDVNHYSTISGRKDINVFDGIEELNSVFTHLPIQHTFTSSPSASIIYKKVTFVKNTWF